MAFPPASHFNPYNQHAVMYHGLPIAPTTQAFNRLPNTGQQNLTEAAHTAVGRQVQYEPQLAPAGAHPAHPPPMLRLIDPVPIAPYFPLPAGLPPAPAAPAPALRPAGMDTGNPYDDPIGDDPFLNAALANIANGTLRPSAYALPQLPNPDHRPAQQPARRASFFQPVTRLRLAGPSLLPTVPQSANFLTPQHQYGDPAKLLGLQRPDSVAAMNEEGDGALNDTQANQATYDVMTKHGAALNAIMVLMHHSGCSLEEAAAAYNEVVGPGLIAQAANQQPNSTQELSLPPVPNGWETSDSDSDI